MKLAVVFPVHNQFPIASAVIDEAWKNLSGKHEVKFLILDNGSRSIFLKTPPKRNDEYVPLTFSLVRFPQNIGVYPTFWQALEHTNADIVAYFHTDLFVAEPGWDERVIRAFEADPQIGLVGFIGSDEIDGSGGRGLGTSSNFLGGVYAVGEGNEILKEWHGSPAEVHGRRETEYMNAAVVDGCAMIFRRSVLEAIPQRPDFPPHHFYDRLLSTEVLERGFKVGVLGVSFDHISGQTVNQEQSYHTMAEEWATAHGIPKHEGGWDATLYLEAERQWIAEYRDTKHLIPCKV